MIAIDVARTIGATLNDGRSPLFDWLRDRAAGNVRYWHERGGVSLMHDDFNEARRAAGSKGIRSLAALQAKP